MWGALVLVASLALGHVVHLQSTVVIPPPSLSPSRWLSRSLPVQGNVWPVAIFWTSVSLGTPPRSFPVAIDSGSMTLNVPMLGCVGCVHSRPNNVYSPSASNSSQKLVCPNGRCSGVLDGTCQKGLCVFSNTYQTCVPTDPNQECSIDGVWFRDVVSMGGSRSVPVQFGAILNQTANFQQFNTIDGVLGMSGGPISNPQNVLAALARAKAIPDWLWTICLQPGAFSNGTMTLGVIDKRLYTGTIQYTPNIGGNDKPDDYYTMEAKSISIGGNDVELHTHQCILDSGTNIWLVPSATFRSMKKVLLSLCRTTKLHGICDVASDRTLFDGVCYVFSAAQIAAFPAITLRVNGLDLVTPPASYILKNYGVNYKHDGQFCLGVADTGEGGFFIVGDTLMQQYMTVFDQTNNRIGFAPVSSQCGNIQ